MQRIQQLEALLYKYEKSYRDGNSEISDFEFDMYVSELRDLYSGDIPSESILNKIISDTPVEGFEKTQHLSPMLSLSNTYNKDELMSWLKTTNCVYEKQDIIYRYFVEQKIDGCSLSCIYENGKLKRIVTRGDGITGEDITCNKFIIDGIPDKLSDSKINIDIRGEVYMEYAEFERINKELIDKGEEPYANPRNLTAGTIKLLDRDVIKTRHLKFFAHTLGENNLDIEDLTQFADYCNQWGIKFVPGYYCCGRDVFESIDKIENIRKDLPYPIDGAVVKHVSLDKQLQLGTTSKSPKWGIAYKYEAEKAEAKVLGITLQVGRTGQITPVAELSPTQLSGSTVKRATCHNIDEMISRDIRIGDIVLIEKSGDVIPYLIKSLPEKRDSNSIPYIFDEKCPVCGSKAIKYGDKKAWYCSNKKCPSVLQQRFEYFVSRNCMNIEGVSGKLIEKFISHGILNEFKDLFTIKYENIVNLEKLGETSANNIINAIQTCKTVDLWRIIAAIGLPGIGKTNAKAIANDCKNITEFVRRLKDNNCAMWFKGIGSIGEIISADIADWSQNIDNIVELDNLVSVLDVKCVEEAGNKLSGKKICITGTFSQPRETLIQIIEANGGKFVGSVSKKTDYLLAGENCGSKLKKAQQLNITIVYDIQSLI